MLLFLATLLLALPARALPAGTHACESWEGTPVAANLHPVRWNHAERFWIHTEAALGGPRSSPIFHRWVGEADAHWRLIAASGVGLRTAATNEEAWLETAAVSAFLGAERLVGETAARSEEVSALRLAVDTVLSPRLDLTFRKDGRVEASHPTGWALGERIQRQEEEAGLELSAQRTGRNGRRSTAPKLSVGVGWRLRDLDADPAEPLLSWSASMSVRNVGLSLWRADVSLIDGHWTAFARRQLVDGLSAQASLKSLPTAPTPNRWATGLIWSPAPRWVVRLERSAPLEGETWAVDASLRIEIGAKAPSTLERPLAPWPVLPDESPNRLGPVSSSSLRDFVPRSRPTSGCEAQP